MENFISKSQKDRDIENVFQCYDELAGIINACSNIAKRYNYKNLSGLIDAGIDFSAEFSRIANFIVNPDAVDYLPEVLQKENSFNSKILKA